MQRLFNLLFCVKSQKIHLTLFYVNQCVLNVLLMHVFNELILNFVSKGNSIISSAITDQQARVIFRVLHFAVFKKLTSACLSIIAFWSA